MVTILSSSLPESMAAEQARFPLFAGKREGNRFGKRVRIYLSGFGQTGINPLRRSKQQSLSSLASGDPSPPPPRLLRTPPTTISMRTLPIVPGFLASIAFLPLHPVAIASTHYPCEDIRHYYSTTNGLHGIELQKQLGSIVSVHDPIPYRKVRSFWFTRRIGFC